MIEHFYTLLTDHHNEFNYQVSPYIIILLIVFPVLPMTTHDLLVYIFLKFVINVQRSCFLKKINHKYLKFNSGATSVIRHKCVRVLTSG